MLILLQPVFNLLQYTINSLFQGDQDRDMLLESDDEVMEVLSQSQSQKRSQPKPSSSGETSKKLKTASHAEDKQFMANLTTCMSSVTRVLDTDSDKDNDSHGLWAKLFARKLRQMDPLDAEELKLKMDTMALKKLKEARN